MAKEQEDAPSAAEPTERQNEPTAYVLHRGRVGRLGTRLVHDFRHIMRPNTSLKLQERRSNKVRDFLHVCGPLGVTHLVIFGEAHQGLTMRVIKTPQGPTVHFNVLEYSLSHDLRAIQAAPHISQEDFLCPPLVILDGFAQAAADKPHLNVVSALFRHMFPPLSVAQTPLSAVRRAVLFSYDAARDAVLVRHYALTLRDHHDAAALPLTALLERGERGSLDLGRFDSLKDFIDAQRRAQPETEARPRKVLALHELGPRLTLQCLRIEDGVDAGAVLYHRHETKTPAEAAHLAALAAQSRAARERAAREQERAAERRHRELAEEAKSAERRRVHAAEEVLQRVGFERDDEGNLVAGPSLPQPGDSAELYAAPSRKERKGERDKQWREGRLHERHSGKATARRPHGHVHRRREL